MVSVTWVTLSPLRVVTDAMRLADPERLDLLPTPDSFTPQTVAQTGLQFVSYPVLWAKGLGHSDTVSPICHQTTSPSVPFLFPFLQWALKTGLECCPSQHGAEPAASFFPPWTWLALINSAAPEVEVPGKDELRIVGTNCSSSQEQRRRCPKAWPGTGTVCPLL